MIGNRAQKDKDDRDEEEITGPFTAFKVSLCPGSNRQTEGRETVFMESGESGEEIFIVPEEQLLLQLVNINTL